MDFQRLTDYLVKKSTGIIEVIILGIVVNILTQVLIGGVNLVWMSIITILVGTLLILLLLLLILFRPKYTSKTSIWNLSKRNRVRLYNEWNTLEADQRVPYYGQAIPLEYQEQRQHILPIDFDPINALFRFLDMKQICLKIPLKPEEYYEIRDNFANIVDDVYQECKKLYRTDKSGELRKIYDSIYDDLSLRADYDGKMYDLVVIPGARTIKRAENAKDLYHTGLVKKIYLSGNFPSYVKKTDDQYQYISEAEAMAIYLCDICDTPVPQQDIMMDKYAKNTEENARFTISTLKRLSTDVFHKQLDVLLMTSPYHLKRFSLYFQWIKKRQLEFAINRIGGYITATKYSKDNWFSSIEGFRTYLSEYWKIHGGRITGDF